MLIHSIPKFLMAHVFILKPSSLRKGASSKASNSYTNSRTLVVALLMLYSSELLKEH